MDRLTYRRPDGRVETVGKAYSDLHMDYVCHARINDKYDVRLAAYEDTGLMPEDINQLRTKLESLTPGGSEFVGDPDWCIRWVEERLGKVKQLHVERDAAAERLQQTEKALELACELHCFGDSCPSDDDCNDARDCEKCWRDYFLQQAKEGEQK